MSMTEKELQEFINKIGAKIQSMADVSYDRVLEFSKCAAKLADLPLDVGDLEALEMLHEYTIKRDVETEHCEKLQELAKMYNEFFVK